MSDIGEQQVDGSGVQLAQEQRLGWVSARENTVAVPPKQLDDRAQQRFFILDHEDGLASTRRRMPLRRGDGRLGPGHAAHPRKVDVEARAFAGLALHANRAATSLHEAVHRRETETRPTADRLRREERLEGAGHRRAVHSDAPVSRIVILM